jgi:nucleoside phosphorylase
MARGTDLLILAAHPVELLGLRAALGDSLRARMHGVAVAAADVGVGLTVAGACAMRHLLQEQPRCAIVVGSYGRYPSAGAGAYVPGQLLVPTRLQLVDSAVLTGQAAFPTPMQIAVEPEFALSEALAKATPGVLRDTVATALGITQDDALARLLENGTGCLAENLEALAIGLACAQAGVVWSALLACSNEVGAHGRSQWAANHSLAATAAATHVLAWLAQGAPGLPAGPP